MVFPNRCIVCSYRLVERLKKMYSSRLIIPAAEAPSYDFYWFSARTGKVRRVNTKTGNVWVIPDGDDSWLYPDWVKRKSIPWLKLDQ